MNNSIDTEYEDLTHSDLSFLKELEEYSFDSKMLMCQRFSSRIMNKSEVDMKLALDNNIMPWELETFVTFSVLYDKSEVNREIDIDAFSKIITKIRNFWHPELTIAELKGTYSEVFMMITALQQFSTQGIFLQKLFRYNYFFTFTNDTVDMKMEFNQKFNTSYEEYLLFAFIIFIYCSHESHISGGAESCQRLITKAFKLNNAFKTLMIEKEDYKVRLESLYKDNVVDYYYGLKIQYVYPLISGVDYTYIPSPYLVINSITESLLNRLTYEDVRLRNILGKEVIENYLFDIYEEVPEVKWISPEIIYYVGKDEKRTSDVLVSEGQYCSFYDTKALSPNLKIRQFDKKEIEREIKIYAKNIIQIYQQIRYYGEGYFSLNEQYEKKNIFGVVVVLEDAVLPRYKVYDKVFELLEEEKGVIADEEKNYIHSHIKIVPLRDIELMILQNMSYLPCLIKQESDMNRWDDITFSIPDNRYGLLPCYEKFVTELKSNVQDFLRK